MKFSKGDEVELPKFAKFGMIWGDQNDIRFQNLSQ